MNTTVLRIVPSAAILCVLAACSPTADTPKPQEPAAKQEPEAPKVDFAKIEKTGDPAIDALADFVAEARIPVSAPDWRLRLPKPPQVQFAEGKAYYWDLATNQGPIKVRLHPEAAPMHVSSTIYLTKLGFYDSLTFHRVIPGFMAQGGDPLGTGSGGPGYQYSGEFFVHCPNAECGKDYMGDKTTTILGNQFFVCPHCGKASAVKLRHDHPGMLSMAHAGPGTDGSQFFLTFGPTPHLDGKHTVFGEIVDGMDTMTALEKLGSPSGKTSQKLEITRATISIE